MYSQVEIYKLSFSPIPNTILDMQVLLEQLKSLKPSFKTLEILRKMKDIEVKITAQETKWMNKIEVKIVAQAAKWYELYFFI